MPPGSRPLLAPTMIGALLTHVIVIGPQPASVVAVLLLVGVLAVGRSYWRAADAFKGSPTVRPSIET